MFVTFEGPEGAGKSTVLATVAEALRASGREVLTTREPGSGRLGQGIRELLLHGGEMPAESELFLFLADRSNHVRTIVRPALERGEIVLCDRFADSTLVYQALARGLDEAFIREANAFATGGLKPDVTFLLDLAPEIGLSRLESKDRLDAEPLEFHRRVREGFLAEASRDPARWRILEASQPAKEVAERVLAELRTRGLT
ncbi:MAG TPA: dTMP kinase [Fimbriimonas sp.]